MIRKDARISLQYKILFLRVGQRIEYGQQYYEYEHELGKIIYANAFTAYDPRTILEQITYTYKRLY